MNYKKNIIWLASYPKSGNTWVRMFLQHVLGSTSLTEGFPYFNDIPIGSSRMLIDHFSGVSSSDLTDEEIQNIRPNIYQEFSSQSSDLQVVKIHDAFCLNSSGHPLFPPEITRAVVYIVRNPLDIAVSYAFHSGKSIQAIIRQLNDPDFEISKNEHQLKPQVTQHLGNWSQHVIGWTEQKILPVILLTYEQLIDNSRLAFSDLLYKLKITIEEEKFEKALKACDFNYLKAMELSHGFREKPIQAEAFFREGKKDNYKNHLDEKQIQEILDHHQRIMHNFGYANSIT